jgi:hypothetical protein
MRTYATTAWFILCASIGTTFGQQPNASTRDPFLNSGFLEPVGDRADGARWSNELETRHIGLSPDATYRQPEFEPLGPDPRFDPLDPSEDALSVQYPLDQEDYQSPVAPPEQSSRSWVPPVLRRPDNTTGHGGRWLQLKSTKAALTHVGSGGSLGITTFQVRPTIEFPGSQGLFVTPNFGWHFLDGPTTTDLPSDVYDVSLDVSLYRPIGDKWLVQVAIVPGIYTDGDNTSTDALRVQGRVMGFYTMNSGKQLVLGIVYLDREDIPVLPTFGVVWQPRDDLRYELMFPKPRLSWRQYAEADWEQWVYVTGELGGGSWAVRRTTGLDDIATYRDLRFVIGLERKRTTGRSWHVEAGYVFARELEFDSSVGDVSFDETAFIRIGGSF